MESILKRKLHSYVISHNPELLLKLQENLSLTTYIQDKVELVMPIVIKWTEQGMHQYEIEELALQEMTTDLRPSKFLYLKNVLEEEFPGEYAQFIEAGVLTYELINMMEDCAEIFKTFEFSESTEDNRFLRYAVIAMIQVHLL